MKRFIKNFFPFVAIFIISLLTSCSGGNGVGTFISANLVSVDRTNDRVFILQNRGTVFAYTASTFQGLGSQPLIDKDTETLYDLVPSVVSKMVVASNSSTSRLFLLGAIDTGSGDLVLNQIRVLDFDGTSFSEATFSPIELSDGDTSTDETDNSFSDMTVDSDRGVLYITDTTAGKLYSINISNGAQTRSPVTIAGQPQGLAYDNGRLYVCNSSSTAAEQVITVFDVTDFTTSTSIDLDMPCRQLNVLSNDTGTVLIAKSSSNQNVLVRSVNTTTYSDSTAISASTSGISDGLLTTNAGVSSTILSMALSKNSTGTIFAYLGEQDGNIQFLTVASDLTSFTHETLSTSVTSISDFSTLTSSTGVASLIYMTADSGALLSITSGTSDISIIN